MQNTKGLTRRRSHPDRNSWYVYCGDVRIGVIAERPEVPGWAPRYEWVCGFYPGMEPGQHTNGRADTFDAAREAFQRAWEQVLPTLTEAHFAEWRDWQEAAKDRPWNRA